MGPTNNRIFATTAPIRIPTEPIGSIPAPVDLPVDLIERLAKGDSEDPNLAPLYEDAIRDSDQRVFVGVIAPNKSHPNKSHPNKSHLETPEEVRDRVLIGGY